MTVHRPIQSLGGTYSDGATEPGGITVGFQFTVSAACSLTAIGFWQPSVNASPATRFLCLWSTADAVTQGPPLVYGAPTAPSAGAGWKYSAGLVQSDGVTPVAPYALTPGTTYIAGVFHPSGGYSAISGFFSTGPGASGAAVGPVIVPSQATALANKQGLYDEGTDLEMPNLTFGGNNYGVDIQVEVAEAAGSWTWSNALRLG